MPEHTAPDDRAMLALVVDGRSVEVPDDGSSLLGALRDHLRVLGPKDGCSPQGQCGCCTVLVDGSPRVACVTPVRRVQGRSITTVDGLEPDVRRAWGDAFCATGGSQCGFCTPGIVLRFEALRRKGTDPSDRRAVEQALLAHLCRCTGWNTVVDAFGAYGRPSASNPERDLGDAARRAAIEGGTSQRVAPKIVLGHGGFADDLAPPGALVAVPDGRGGWAVGESLHEARLVAGKVQGRRTTADLRHPVELPAGEWARVLQTTWVEPAYLEPDASWCEPGGAPASPLANGGAFGGKLASVAPRAARALADAYGRAVRVVLAREDVVRLGPKRPPIAAGIRADGSGVVRAARTPGLVEAVASVAPALAVAEIDVAGPPTSAAIRGAGWVEAAVLLGSVSGRAEVRSPVGAKAEAIVEAGGRLSIRVSCGKPLDEVVLRSYCVGAAHQATGWVTSEGLSVDDEGEIHDLTIRSFGILRAVDMPAVDVEIDRSDGPPLNGSDAVFAAVALAVWRHQGFPPRWPTGVSVRAG